MTDGQVGSGPAKKVGLVGELLGCQQTMVEGSHLNFRCAIVFRS